VYGIFLVETLATMFRPEMNFCLLCCQRFHWSLSLGRLYIASDAPSYLKCTPWKIGMAIFGCGLPFLVSEIVNAIQASYNSLTHEWWVRNPNFMVTAI